MAELADELALLRPAAAGVSEGERRDDDPPTWDWRLIAPLLGVRGPPPLLRRDTMCRYTP